MKYTIEVVETVSTLREYVVEAESLNQAEQLAIMGETISEDTIQILGVDNRTIVNL